MKNKLFYIFLVLGLILSCSTYAQVHIGITASQEGTPTITNYVFDGFADAYFKDEAATPTMLDGIATPQTWVIRMKIDVTTDVAQGMLGIANGFANSLRWEIDAGDLTKFDLALRGDGTSSIINVIWGPDTGWATYFWTYNSTVGMEIFKGNTSLKTDADIGFTVRTAGMALEVGATNTATTPQLFRGEISNIQLYARVLSSGEIASLTADITNTAPQLVLDFAEKKTSTTWTSNIDSNDKLTNQGGVTTN